MFDIGFSELLVIALVALVVIGPERLPKVARTIGLLLGRMQRYVADVKMEIGREMQLDELKRLQAEVTQSAHALEDSVREEIDAAKSVFTDTVQPLQSAVDDALSDNGPEIAAPHAENQIPVIGAHDAPPEENSAETSPFPLESPGPEAAFPLPASPDPDAPRS